MVGLNKIWIVLSTLFLLAACVPQTKQTQCKTEEAFNATLRTCVPVMKGPSAFITIGSFLPTVALTKYKDDTNSIKFEVTVENPFAQSYSVKWERLFGGTSYPITPTTQTSYITTPFALRDYIGMNVIVARILDGSGNVVDSHSFELLINENPRPVISSSTITPPDYAIVVTPVDPDQVFSFTIRNNNATISGAGYKTSWTLAKNGVSVPSASEDDLFGTTGTFITPTGSNYASFTFPLNNTGHNVGNYLLRARITNNSNETVAEQQWSIVVQHPNLGNVTNVSRPAPGVATTAYNNLNYSQYTTYNFLYPTAQRGQYCVEVDDADGTYPGDAKGVKVQWFLNGSGAHIYERSTDDLGFSTQELCLIDGTFDTTILRFINTSSTVTQNHYISARIIDEATGTEFATSNVKIGSYPIKWDVVVKPTNTAPVPGFGATQPAGCTIAGGYTRSNCQVTQGTPFTVGLTITDDFYNPAVGADAANLSYTATLKYNGVDIAGVPVCTKPFTNTTTTVSGQYTCTFTVPHYLSTGPLDPTSGTFSVVASVQDNGSPVAPGAGLVGTNLTWNLVVTEANSIIPNITVSNQAANNLTSYIANGAGTALDPGNTASFVTEGDTISFFLQVTDPEIDDFQYRISLCTVNTPSTCSGSVAITNPSYVKFTRSLQTTPTTNPRQVNALLYTIPEDLLLTLGHDIDKTTSQLVYFKVDVNDVPSVPTTTVRTDTKTFSVYVRNKNPAPVINTASANPAPTAPGLNVMSGYPLTIDPGSVTDASVPASEKTIVYQWFARTGGTAPWFAIPGATERILRWTPDQQTLAAPTIELKLCTGDRPSANPINSASVGTDCSPFWTVTPKNNFRTLAATGIGGANADNAMAVWHDSFNPDVIYSAYSGSGGRIYVEKTLKDASGNLDSTTFQTVSFNALSVGTLSTLSNLSLTGTANSLYISYLASSSAAPSVLVPRLRRIDKSFNAAAAPGSKTGFTHGGKFGFQYDQYNIDVSSCSVCTRNISPGDGTESTIQFSAGMPDLETININGVIFTPNNPATGMNDVCGITAGCGANANATSLAQKINAHTDVRLQGITAWASGSTVTLYGMVLNDFIEFDGSMGLGNLASPSNGLGKIFISSGYWYMPFIDSTQGGANQNRISVISGLVDVHLRRGSGALALDTNRLLDTMGKASAFDAKLSSDGSLFVAHISAELSDAGTARVYKFTKSGPQFWDPPVSNTTVFPGNYFEYIRVSPNSTGNNNVFVLARERAVDGSKYRLGRYSTVLGTQFENLVTNLVDTTDGSDDVISDSLMQAPEIISMPNSSEARLLFNSTGTPALALTPRLARVKSDNSITCGFCAPLTTAVSSTAVLGFTPVVSDVTIGSAGMIANENQKDVIFTLFNFDNGGGTWRGRLGILNQETEPIQSTSLDATNRLYRPPFIKD